MFSELNEAYGLRDTPLLVLAPSSTVVYPHISAGQLRLDSAHFEKWEQTQTTPHITINVLVHRARTYLVWLQTCLQVIPQQDAKLRGCTCTTLLVVIRDESDVSFFFSGGSGSHGKDLAACIPSVQSVIYGRRANAVNCGEKAASLPQSRSETPRVES
jgi:hypothetical protein